MRAGKASAVSVACKLAKQVGGLGGLNQVVDCPAGA